MRFVLSLLFVYTWCISLVSSSWGDQSSYNQMCVQHCQRETCNVRDKVEQWAESQATLDRLVGFTCQDDCKYTCMWQTVEEMETRHGMATGMPQFYGKWPFVRMFGMQEPASAVFSVLNLVTNLYMFFWFRNNVPSEAPMYNVWMLYSLTAINAWTCSTIFHTRDTDLTEMLDYFSAFLTVLTSLLVCVIRMVGVGGNNNVAAGLVIALFVAFYSNHVYNMAFIRFDYGYNMKVNVTVGVLNGLMWLGWSVLHYSDGGHVKRGVQAILILSLSVLLELLDFPPWWWSVDSHALWHAATVPIPFLWFTFAAGDCLKLARDTGLSKKLT